MVFALNAQTRQLEAHLPTNTGVEDFECVIRVCPNPACWCATVHLTLRAHSSGETPKPLVPLEHNVSLNLDTKAIDDKFRKTSSRDQRVFSEELLKAMDPPDFALLTKLHHQLKNRITEEAKPGDIDAHFDFNAVEQSSVMQTYNHILPYAEQLRLTVDSVDYFAMDVYCLKRRCRCNDAFIDLLPFEGEDRLGESIGTLEVDYMGKRWQAGVGIVPSCDPAIWGTRFEKAIPNFYKKLQSRHERLRAIYAHSRQRAHIASTKSVATDMPGRNDPCPCGSGKKFKKCCMAEPSHLAF